MRRTRGKSVLFLNNRHYEPTTGVFISVDPLVTMTGQPYIYGAANPITYSDPNGLEPRPIHAKPGAKTVTGETYRPPTDTGDLYASRCGGYGCGGWKSVPGGQIMEWPDWYTPPHVADAQGAFVDAGTGLSLTPNTPSRPGDPLEGAMWDFMYGGRQSDSDVWGDLAGLLDTASPYVAGGALMVCIVGAAGVCGVVTAVAAGYAVTNNVVACAAECENYGDLFETMAKTGVDVALARLPAPNGPISAGSLQRLTGATGLSGYSATTVVRDRRIVVSAVGTAGSSWWNVP